MNRTNAGAFFVALLALALLLVPAGGRARPVRAIEYSPALACGGPLAIGNGIGLPGNDGTVPSSGPADCDADDDDDGLPDLGEPIGAACGGIVTESPAGGFDITNDDDADGAVTYGVYTDPPDDGTTWDTDADGYRDGPECALGFDPTSSASKPTLNACAAAVGAANNAVDADADGLGAGTEYCHWGTSDTPPLGLDSDGDGLLDSCEVADLNGDGVAGPADLTAAQLVAAGLMGRDGDFDIDGDGAINVPVDAVLVARMVLNSDADQIDNGPGVAPVDDTVPNGDLPVNACDTDDDNDGLPDWRETPLAGCVAFNGVLAGHPEPWRGDFSNDDNGNGNPAPPMGADLADNGPSWDTDNDGVLDGAECALGTNPRDRTSRPTLNACAVFVGAASNAVDADLDGLGAGTEFCKWGTSDALADSDGDGTADCVEANDTDGNGFATFPGDTINSAMAANNIIGKTMDFDLDGSGSVNFPGDTILSAKMVFGVGGIC